MTRTATARAPNLLILRIQPEEGISLKFLSKRPGAGMTLRPVSMDFNYGSSFGERSPSAYETLLLDAIIGDATLYTRQDMVEASWTVVEPIQKVWRDTKFDFPNYAGRHLGTGGRRRNARPPRPRLEEAVMSATVSPDRILKELSDLWVDAGQAGAGGNGAGVLRACSMTLIVLAEEADDPARSARPSRALMPEHPGAHRARPAARRRASARSPSASTRSAGCRSASAARSAASRSRSPQPMRRWPICPPWCCRWPSPICR